MSSTNNQEFFLKYPLNQELITDTHNLGKKQ